MFTLACLATVSGTLIRLPFLLINLALYPFAWYGALACYLLIHAVLAALLGGTVFGLHLGGGPILYETSVGKTLVYIHRYPTLSYFYTGFPQQPGAKIRALLLYSGGIVLLLVLLFLLARGIDVSRLGTGLAVREVFLLAVLILTLATLPPASANVGGAQIPSNTRLVIQLLRNQITEAQLHETYVILKSSFAISRRAYHEALTTCQEGLQVYPRHVMLTTNHGVSLLELDYHAEALQVFQEGEAAAAESPYIQAILWNNAGWTALLLDQVDLAYGYAQQAFALIPWEPSIQGTWGAVLVERGELNAGIEHLLRAFATHTLRRNRAINLAYAAIGYERLGDTQQAQAYLQRAMAIDSSAPLIHRARQELHQEA
jgi:Tfp pilus assembly protein PilF